MKYSRIKSGNKNVAVINESARFSDVLKKCSFNSFVVVDLDNTVIESAEDSHLGSDQWFDALLQYANEIIIDTADAATLVLTIYAAVQMHIKAKAVDPEIVSVIKTLQDIGIPVLVLTARGREVIEPTLRQLNEVGIDFSKQWETGRSALILDHKHTATYCNGIIFCEGYNKGKCLEKFFEERDYRPSHVVMIDDKEKHLTRVGEMVTSHGGQFDGLRFNYLDPKVACFESAKAMKSLTQISGLFSESIRSVMKKLKIEIASAEEGPSLQCLTCQR